MSGVVYFERSIVAIGEYSARATTWICWDTITSWLFTHDLSLNRQVSLCDWACYWVNVNEEAHRLAVIIYFPFIAFLGYLHFTLILSPSISRLFNTWNTSMEHSGLSSISEIVQINRFQHSHMLSSIQVRVPGISSRVGLKGIESTEISFISAKRQILWKLFRLIVLWSLMEHISDIYNVLLQVEDEALYALGHLLNLINQTKPELVIHCHCMIKSKISWTHRNPLCRE
jgi:hypothetical protein